MSRVAAALALAAALLGCSTRKKPPPAPSEPPTAEAPSAEPAFLPSPWRFEKLNGAGGLALPAGCTFTEPTAVARIPAGRLRFVAAQGAPAQLAVFDPSDDAAPPKHGIVPLSDKYARATRDLPWTSLDDAPVLAASRGRWLGLVAGPMTPPLARVLLWREGDVLAKLADGDHLAPIDLRCDAERCAALTTRASTVAALGATLFVGPPDAPPEAGWKAHDLGEDDASTPGKPFAIAGLHGDEVDVALADRDGISIVRVSPRGVDVGPHLRAHYGVLDVVTLPAAAGDGAPAARVALAATLPEPIDDAGCSGAGSRITIERSGGEAVTVRTYAAPLSAFLRPIGKGALVAWLAPVSCRDKKRLIVHAMLLDGAGAPLSADTAVDDATGLAIETRGDDLELFLRTDEGVKWVRGRCSAERAATR